ncbi:MAG: hypothetical protein E5Y83_33255, partial [Mesorhizobium sp.]
MSLVARRHDINANLLFTWRRQMCASVLAASPLELILIEVTSGAPVAVPTAAAEMERRGVIGIVLTGGVRVRVDEVSEAAGARCLIPGFDGASLTCRPN